MLLHYGSTLLHNLTKANNMKTKLDILRISAGRIEEGGMLYANAIILDEEIANDVEPDRIDVGQKHAKIKMETANDNKLAISLANSGLIPGSVTVTVKTSVKKNEAVMMITGFEPK